MQMNENRICRVCGYEYKDFYPWGEDGRCGTFDFCVCCGVAFGSGDATLNAVKATRAKWIASGAQWEEPELRSPDWNLEKSLANVPDRFK